MEPILISSSDRFTVYPIRHHDIWSIYKEAERSFWTAEDCSISTDERSVMKANLSFKQIFYIDRMYLALLNHASQAYRILDLFSQVQIAESRCSFGYWIAISNIHAEAYSMILNGKDIGIPLMHSDITFNLSSIGHKVFIEACKEAIYFCMEICSIRWIGCKAYIDIQLKINELMVRDRALHVKHLTVIYSLIQAKLCDTDAHAIVRSIVDEEVKFALETLPISIIDIDESKAITYIQFTADTLLSNLGYETIYKVANPFEWAIYHACDRHETPKIPAPMIRVFTLDEDF